MGGQVRLSRLQLCVWDNRCFRALEGALNPEGALKPGRTHAGPQEYLRAMGRADMSDGACGHVNADMSALTTAETSASGGGHVQPFFTLNHLTVPVTFLSAMFLFPHGAHAHTKRHEHPVTTRTSP